MSLLRVYNVWSLFGAIIIVIIIYNLWSKGNTTVTLANGFSNLLVNMTKALEVKPE